MGRFIPSYHTNSAAGVNIAKGGYILFLSSLHCFHCTHNYPNEYSRKSQRDAMVRMLIVKQENFGLNSILGRSLITSGNCTHLPYRFILRIQWEESKAMNAILSFMEV